jgi:hypothetical protein
MAYGTLTRFDTLATAYNTTVAKFGEDLAWQAIQDALDAHNQQLNEAMNEFVESSTDRLRRYGGPDTMAMDELDEFATPDAQKITAGQTVAFPLKMYGIALQWTRLYFQNAMASEIAAQTIAAQDADIKAIHRELKKALFLTSNYTFLDRRVDGISLGVKALVNADGAAIPIAPDGTTFNGATHTHYLSAVASWSGATAAQIGADLYNASTGLVDTVLEHFLGGQILLLCNRAEETKVRSAVGFTAYLDARLIPATTANQARAPLDMANVTNRAIGIIGPAEVWIKPWVPAGYVLCLHVGQGGNALVRRTREGGGGNLDVLFDNEIYPLRARAMGREFGFGVFNRVAAAVLYTTTGGYVNPVIT